MDFFELMSISHVDMDILNPSSREKILAIGDVLYLNTESRVIDFGSGTGEMLVLWAEKYGLSGKGIDISEQFCEKARGKISERGLDNRIRIVCANGSEYTADDTYDCGLCIGATFIWGGFRQTIQGLKEFVKPGGKIVIGEVYWLKSDIPREYLNGSAPPDTRYEHELLQISNEEGYDIEYMVRASHDDWDRYLSERWRSLVRWIAANPDHPERREIIDYLHKNQDDYLRYEREYIGWAMYVLSPVSY